MRSDNRLIVEDLVALGLSCDLFTRTTAGSHYRVVQDMFATVRDNGYMIEQVAACLSQPLPDRYIEGTRSGEREGARRPVRQLRQPDGLTDHQPHSRIAGET